MRTRQWAVVLVAGALAQPAGADTNPAIEAVIGDQLDAFNDRDIPRAWAHASPTIQGLFGTEDNFALMVQQGYPMIWDNSGADFQDLREIGGRLWQRIFVQDAEGRGYIADYQMVETPEGWRINAVEIRPAPDVGV